MKPVSNPIFREQRARTVRAFAFLLLAACALVFVGQPASAAAQTPAAPRANPKSLAGTWTATFKGITYMKLHFMAKAGKLTATLSNGQIKLGPEGDILSVKVLPGVQKVKVEKLEGNTVYLRQGTKQKPLRFAFRLQDKTHAQLEILHPKPALFDESGPEMAPPKPILLVKQRKANKS